MGYTTFRQVAIWFVTILPFVVYIVFFLLAEDVSLIGRMVGFVIIGLPLAILFSWILRKAANGLPTREQIQEQMRRDQNDNRRRG